MFYKVTHPPGSSWPGPKKASVCVSQLVFCASCQSSCRWGRMAVSDYGQDHPVHHGAPALEWSQGSWEVRVHVAQGGRSVHQRGRGVALRVQRTGAWRRTASGLWRQRGRGDTGWSRAAPGCWSEQAGWSWSCAAWLGSPAAYSQHPRAGRCLHCGTSSSPPLSIHESPVGAR